MSKEMTDKVVSLFPEQHDEAIANALDMQDMLADMAAEEEPAESELQRAIKLGTLLVKQKKDVEDLEEKLKEAKDKVKQTETVDLPELLKEVGLTKFTLDDGAEIELKEEIQCGISEERRPRAHAWLVENKFGGLIKTEVVVAFDRDKRTEADELQERLEEEGVEGVTKKELVHPQTLKAFVKEQLEKATANFPMELFGVFSYNVVKVTLPKKKKGK